MEMASFNELVAKARENPILVLVVLVVIIVANSSLDLQIPEKIGKANDDFKAWAAREPAGFSLLIVGIVYFLFFYKSGTILTTDWIPFTDVFNKFKNSSNVLERKHFEMIEDNYEIDHEGGGFMAQDATTQNSLMVVFYRKKLDATKRDIPDQYVAGYDLKRLPHPAGASRLRFACGKTIFFALNSASDLSGAIFKIQGTGDANQEILKLAKEEGLTQEYIAMLTQNQGGIAKQQGLMQR